MYGCQFVGFKKDWAAEWMPFLNNEVAHLNPPLYLKQKRRSLVKIRGRNLPKGSASTEVSYTTGAWVGTKFWHHMRK